MRHHGLDKIAPSLPPAKRVEGLRTWQARERDLRELLVACGLTEVINYAFISAASTAAVAGAPVALLNPLSEDQAVLRRSVVVPGLLSTLDVNLRQGRRDLGVFEIGRVFGEARPLPHEERRLGVLLHGSVATRRLASDERRAANFFDAKGIVEAIGRRLECALEIAAGETPSYLHPGQSALVRANGQTIGSLGAVHPDVAAQHELREAAVLLEIALDGILGLVPSARRLASLARFPAVSRDLSFVCDAGRPAADLVAAARQAGGDLLQSVSVTDLWAGKGIADGKVSLTLTLRYQHPARTLTSEEVQQSVDFVVQALAASGAQMKTRGE